MGISFGPSFGYLVFALANVGQAVVKKSNQSFFHNNILQMCPACVVWAIQPLAVAGCHRLFLVF
jgi:hypothetical protein